MSETQGNKPFNSSKPFSLPSNHNHYIDSTHEHPQTVRNTIQTDDNASTNHHIDLRPRFPPAPLSISASVILPITRAHTIVYVAHNSSISTMIPTSQDICAYSAIIVGVYVVASTWMDGRRVDRGGAVKIKEGKGMDRRGHLGEVIPST